jgi:ABC-type polysaccharide/polyol phosphate transport system ATPase subunit
VSPAIELSGMGKRYWRLEERAMLLRSLLPFARHHRQETWALRDVNLQIDCGETVGVLGRNGAGKTTLLRLLAGVSQPTEGRVRVVGRIAPLISLGVGFHPEMSGRENVLVNGMLLGLTRAQVVERFDAIVEFSELSEFIDTPVKFYSSGMFMRLGMAVAMHVEPRVLLVDEVLAVGDVGFQFKCLERIREMQATGVTVLIASHSVHAIQAACPRALLFDRGRLVFDGDSSTAIDKHFGLLARDNAAAAATGDHDRTVTVVDRVLEGSKGPVHFGERGERLTYRVRLRFERETPSPQLVFRVHSADGTLVYLTRTKINHTYRTFAAGDEVEATLEFTADLGAGNFRLIVNVLSYDGDTTLHDESDGFVTYFPPLLGRAGVADLHGRVTIDGEIGDDHPSMMLDSGRPSL